MPEPICITITMCTHRNRASPSVVVGPLLFYTSRHIIDFTSAFCPSVLLWPHEGLHCSCFPSVAHSVTSPLDLASDFAVVRVNHSRRFQLTCDCGTPAIRRRRQVCLEEIPPSLSSLCVPSPLCCAVTTGARACARARLSFLLRVSRFCCAIELWPSCGYAVAGEPEVDW